MGWCQDCQRCEHGPCEGLCGEVAWGQVYMCKGPKAVAARAARGIKEAT